MRLSATSTALLGALSVLSVALASPLLPRLSPKDYSVSRRIPGVPFDIPVSWAGYMPLSSKRDESRQFFFWLFQTEDAKKDDLVIWLNGGPGCSSLEGLLQENGPFVFPFNTTDGPDAKAVPNPYSWTKLSNVLYVEQPIATGFSRGAVQAKNELDVAKDFYAFLQQLARTFPQFAGKRLYITGESYAGKYIPYIAQKLYQSGSSAPFSLQGIGINDPSFTSDALAEDIPMLDFAKHFQKDLLLSDAFIQQLTKKAEKAGIADYLEKHLVYPPKGPLKLPKTWDQSKFSPANDVYNEATKQWKNQFNIYNVKTSGKTTDPLGYPPAAADGSTYNVVNNIPGFKQAIHADVGFQWLECAGPVFVNDTDRSPPPDVAGVMQYVIEKSPAQKTVIQHGVYDAILIANGSALAIQNITFHDSLGFSKPPTRTFLSQGKKAGSFGVERGLTFVRVDEAGHMIPQDQPATAFKLHKYLLGQITAEQLSA